MQIPGSIGMNPLSHKAICANSPSAQLFSGVRFGNVFSTETDKLDLNNLPDNEDDVKMGLVLNTLESGLDKVTNVQITMTDGPVKKSPILPDVDAPSEWFKGSFDLNGKPFSFSLSSFWFELETEDGKTKTRISFTPNKSGPFEHKLSYGKVKSGSGPGTDFHCPSIASARTNNPQLLDRYCSIATRLMKEKIMPAFKQQYLQQVYDKAKQSGNYEF